MWRCWRLDRIFSPLTAASPIPYRRPNLYLSRHFVISHSYPAQQPQNRACLTENSLRTPSPASGVVRHRYLYHWFIEKCSHDVHLIHNNLSIIVDLFHNTNKAVSASIIIQLLPALPLGLIIIKSLRQIIIVFALFNIKLHSLNCLDFICSTWTFEATMGKTQGLNVCDYMRLSLLFSVILARHHSNCFYWQWTCHTKFIWFKRIEVIVLYSFVSELFVTPSD